METVKRILDWLSGEEAATTAETMPDDIVFEIDTFEDAARVAMGCS